MTGRLYMGIFVFATDWLPRPLRVGGISPGRLASRTAGPASDSLTRKTADFAIRHTAPRSGNGHVATSQHFTSPPSTVALSEVTIQESRTISGGNTGLRGAARPAAPTAMDPSVSYAWAARRGLHAPAPGERSAGGPPGRGQGDLVASTAAASPASGCPPVHSIPPAHPHPEVSKVRAVRSKALVGSWHD